DVGDVPAERAGEQGVGLGRLAVRVVQAGAAAEDPAGARAPDPAEQDEQQRSGEHPAAPPYAESSDCREHLRLPKGAWGRVGAAGARPGGSHAREWIVSSGAIRYRRKTALGYGRLR